MNQETIEIKVSKLMLMAVKANQKKGNEVFLNFIGHVNSLEIKIKNKGLTYLTDHVYIDDYRLKEDIYRKLDSWIKELEKI